MERLGLREPEGRRQVAPAPGEAHGDRAREDEAEQRELVAAADGRPGVPGRPGTREERADEQRDRADQHHERETLRDPGRRGQEVPRGDHAGVRSAAALDNRSALPLRSGALAVRYVPVPRRQRRA